MEHILLSLAKRYPLIDRDRSPVDARYDAVLGGWVDKASGILVVNRPDANPPQSKKNDVETGEDQKGH